jgi:ribosomal protein S18 acetylase RimI-like enzyme
MTALAFRSMADDDSEEVIALWQACGLIRPWNDPVKDIAFAREGPASDILVAGMNGKIAASVMVGHDGHRGMVYYVSVAPEHQGKGYGKQAMAAAENWLGARGVWKLNLLVRAENEAVRGFYESLGYEVEPRLCMARKLIGDGGR